MDPNQTLKEMLEVSSGIIYDVDAGASVDTDDAIRLAELVRNLHVWICKGGFLPDKWVNKEVPCLCWMGDFADCPKHR